MFGVESIGICPAHLIVEHYPLGGEAGEDLADTFARHRGEDALDLGDRERYVSTCQNGQDIAVQCRGHRGERLVQLHL